MNIEANFNRRSEKTEAPESKTLLTKARQQLRSTFRGAAEIPAASNIDCFKPSRLRKAPRAVFGSAVYDSIVSVDASASKGESDTVLSYVWNFGDGSGDIASSKPIIEHSYATDGDYQISLRVFDGSVTTVAEPITVSVVSNVNELAAYFNGMYHGFVQAS